MEEVAEAAQLATSGGLLEQDLELSVNRCGMWRKLRRRRSWRPPGAWLEQDLRYLLIGAARGGSCGGGAAGDLRGPAGAGFEFANRNPRAPRRAEEAIQPLLHHLHPQSAGHRMDRGFFTKLVVRKWWCLRYDIPMLTVMAFHH